MDYKRLKGTHPLEVTSLIIESASKYGAIDFTQFSNLQSLLISSKKDYVISDSLTQLTNLKDLTIEGPCQLPENIGSMKTLTELRLRDEALFNTPDSIEDLAIEVLDITYYLKDPNAIPSPEWFFKLKNLKKVRFAVCRFSEIKISTQGSYELEELDLACSLTDLTYFPDLSVFTNLKKLTVSGESVQGQRLPRYELLSQLLQSIAPLKQLEELDLSSWRAKNKAERLIDKNGKTTFPDVFDQFPNLIRLYLSDTLIETVPESLLKLKKLKELHLEGTKIPQNELKMIKSGLPGCLIKAGF